MPKKSAQLLLFRPSKAGRPRVPGSVSHLRRPSFPARFPVHVTLRVRSSVWNLRSRRCFRALGKAIEQGRDRFGFRLVHYSVQGNHLHFIAEAPGAQGLARGMQGLAIRMARRLNKVTGQVGPVFASRYHAVVLRSPTQVANAIGYVINNYALHRARAQAEDRDHGQPRGGAAPDRFGSLGSGVPGAAPQGWLLREGWRRARHRPARPSGSPA